jgi:hypothetical protein
MFPRAFRAVLGACLLIGCFRAHAAGPFAVELDGFASFSSLSPFSDASTVFDPWVDPDNPSTALPISQLSLDNYPLLSGRGQSLSFLRSYPGYKEGSPGNRPVINYQVTWDGGGVDDNNQPLNNVLFFNRPFTNFTSSVVNGVRKNSATLPFQYDDGSGEGTLTLRIDNTLAGTSTAVSNLHIVPVQYVNPSTGTAPLYREEFLRKVSPFTVLRMMDWQQTNSGGLVNLDPAPEPFHDPRVVDWVDANVDLANGQNVQGRAQTNAFGRTGIKGVPYEEMVALANEAKKDIWINIPDRATNNYISHLGQLLKNDLDPNVHVYVEFSNELFNRDGSQRWQRVLEDALADTSGAVPIVDGNDPNNQIRTIYRETAKRVTDIGTMLRTEMGLGADAGKRIRPVLAGQTPEPHILQYGLEYLAATKGVAPGQGVNLSDMLAGVAIAPYVGRDVGSAELIKLDPNGTPVKGADGQTVLDSNGQPLLGPDPAGKAQSLDNTPVEQTRYLNWLFPNLQDYVQNKLRLDVRATRQLADKYNLPVLSYEGGQHLVAFNSAFGTDLNGDFKIAANRDPRMGILYHELIQMWSQETGGQLFNQFSLTSPYSNFGSWGLTEDLNQQHSPKWDAVLSELAGDANLDGKVDFNDFAILESNFNKTHTFWGQGDFNLDGAVDYNDFLIFRDRFVPQAGQPVQAAMIEAFAVANVPEPGVAAIAVLLLSVAAMGRRGRIGAVESTASR